MVRHIIYTLSVIKDIKTQIVIFIKNIPYRSCLLIFGSLSVVIVCRSNVTVASLVEVSETLFVIINVVLLIEVLDTSLAIDGVD